MNLESSELETIVDHNRSHSRAAIGTSDTHSKDRCVSDPTKIQNRLVNFARCDIFSFPAISVAYPVDKIIIAGFVEPHQITSAKPGVTRSEHIAQDLLFCLARIGIAVKAAA